MVELTQKELDGYFLECATDASLRKLKVDHESNPLNFEEWKQSQRKGADHRIKVKKRKILIEDKNPNGTYNITPSMFKTDFISRYKAEDPNHKSIWALIVSKPKFSKRVWKIIRCNMIHVITVGFRVTLDNINETCRILTHKLKLFLDKVAPVFSLSKFKGLIYVFYSTLCSFGQFLLNFGLGPPKNTVKSAPECDDGSVETSSPLKSNLGVGNVINVCYEKVKMRCLYGWTNNCKEISLS